MTSCLATRTSGHEVWLDDAWFSLLAMTRDGGPTVRIAHQCEHHELYNYESPATLRRYLGQPCTRCYLFQLGEKRA